MNGGVVTHQEVVTQILYQMTPNVSNFPTTMSNRLLFEAGSLPSSAITAAHTGS